MATPRQSRRRPPRRPSRAEVERLSQEVQAITRFPDQNPNPVLRLDEDGRLLYANPASEPICRGFGVAVGDTLPHEAFAELRRAADKTGSPVELTHDHRTFAVLAVAVPDLGFINLYGTDITAKKAIDKFPDENPNPVLRIDDAGTLIYANAASEPIRRGLGLDIGEQLPRALLADLRRATAATPRDAVELKVEHRTFSLLPVPVPEFGFTNLYGTEVTARKAIDKFPDQNPHPVLRINGKGRLIYANRASQTIVSALGMVLGEPIAADLREQIESSLVEDRRRAIEVSCGERIYEILPVAVPEFGFVNLYGTDVTAARQIAAANRENERLLLNILPPPIADRLRSGERVIADRFDDVTMLFADIVGFTSLSSRLSAEEVVELLNGIFSAVDELVDRHELEKVKTIGDAYMVVGGIPVRLEDHVERVAEMALELTARVEQIQAGRDQHVSLRVGMHCGPAVAGVIGVKKFIYDVWGDTVNVASRMESLGVPGRIHVSPAVYERLAHRYLFEPRGLIDVKGKGPMLTYFLVGRRPGRPRPTERVSPAAQP